MSDAYNQIKNSILSSMTVDEIMKYTAATTLTILSGEVTVVQVVHQVNGEGLTDDTLDTINGGVESQSLILYPADPANTITLSTGVGNIVIPGGDPYELPVTVS